ncbi:capsule biosynthesis GfcC family protein [Vibrio fluvialis]|nr:capsule biosynthesis GfcC family protein [Vibrio fluvialis]ELV8596543.1 capsule biosynthesis GfcC family protein [Vibrio fluvialis]
MNCLKPLSLFMTVLILGSSGISAHESTHVVLHNHQLVLQYNQAVRLDRVLADALIQDMKSIEPHAYHEGSKLFSLNQKKQAAQFYLNVQEQLSNLLNDNDYRVTAKQLLTQLNQFQFGFRLKTNLDVDAVRLKTELNPLLPGNYQLELAHRPNSITLFGLSEEQSTAFQSSFTVADYIERSRARHKSYSSYAWVISPNGDISRVGYAYWNNESTKLQPGSSILVGFNTTDHQLIQLEKDIATLISMIEGPYL